ncbi:low temperature requirement protein A, partial [Oleiphilus sp. HI0066]
MALQDHPMWRKPQHHHDLDHAHDHVHWVELFYDLIHVVTIFLLGNYLSHHLNIDGFLVFCGIFIALWYAWGELSIFNSIYVSTDIWHRIIMSVMICTLMFMA